MIGKVIGLIKENNGNQYFIFEIVDGNKEALRKYTELWDGIKNEAETINDGE